MVRDAIIPGTEQPEPISMEIYDLPDRPNLLNILSIINAARAMYPHSSSSERSKNRIAIWGTKPRTAPTPPMIPSTIRPVSQLTTPNPSRNEERGAMIHSPNRVSFVKSVTKVPTVVTEI